MQIRKNTHMALWFIIPFVVGIGVFTGAKTFFAAPPTSSAPKNGTIATYPLLGRIIPSEYLIAPRTRKYIAEQEWSMPDSSIVVLLGGAGCSGDQVATLRRWSNLPPGSEWQDYDVMAIYADPIVGENTAVMETLVLRRVSRANIPFFVSRDSTFSPRGSGLRTPQVVLVESGRITGVLGTLESPVGP
ncbi:MAG: hypothetical protein F4246_05705 [Rhodothermaceae bacterium]|nr:hypothetical protein [Rhodothermaceae bacterium]